MTHAFRPRLWSIAITILLTALFVSAGIWQLHRGQDKRVLERALGRDADAQSIELALDTPPPGELVAPRARTAGAYDPARQLLLDNQTREHVPGYRVWTPMRLADGGWLMVDRGWVAADPDRRRLPEITVAADSREVRGRWRPLPTPALRLATRPCEPGSFPRVVSYPTVAELACLLGAPVADGLLLLDPTETEGYVREWDLPNPIPPERHFAYAAQWFAFAAVLLFLFIKLNLKHKP